MVSKILEQIPKSITDVIVNTWVKSTIEDQKTHDTIEDCETSTEVNGKDG